jgi:hypothetical protein
MLNRALEPHGCGTFHTADSGGKRGNLTLVSISPVQAEKIESPGTTASYYAWGVEQIAGDIKESVARVSEVAFDASENANIPSVSYEVITSQRARVLRALQRPSSAHCLVHTLHASVVYQHVESDTSFFGSSELSTPLEQHIRPTIAPSSQCCYCANALLHQIAGIQPSTCVTKYKYV